MSHQDEQTLISPDVEKDHISKSNDIIVPTKEPIMTKSKLPKERRGMETMATALGKNLFVPTNRAFDLEGQVPQELVLY